MNLSEAAKLLGLCAAFDQRTVGETDVAAWQETLERISFEDAKNAVKLWYREHRDRIMPADVVGLVRAAWAERAQRAALPAAANPVPMPRELFTLPKPKDEIPRDPTAVDRQAAMEAECLYCGAKPKRPCTSMGKERTSPHPLRGKPDEQRKGLQPAQSLNGWPS